MKEDQCDYSANNEGGEWGGHEKGLEGYFKDLGHYPKSNEKLLKHSLYTGEWYDQTYKENIMTSG